MSFGVYKISHAASEEEQLGMQLDKLRAMRSEVIETLSTLKRHICDAESQQREAVGELEVERGLLETDQRVELENLQKQWQENSRLKQKRLAKLEAVAKQHREEVAKIESAKKKLEVLEQRRQNIEALLSQAPSDTRETLRAQCKTELDAIETQKKHFEDLEFQQLECEAKFETERETVQNDLDSEQTSLGSKIAAAEGQLASITSQQESLLQQTRSDVEDMEAHRQRLISNFHRDKQRLVSLEARIDELERQYQTGDSEKGTARPGQKEDDSLWATPANTMSPDVLKKLQAGERVLMKEKKILETLKHVSSSSSAENAATSPSWPNGVNNGGVGPKSPDGGSSSTTTLTSATNASSVGGKNFGPLDSEEDSSVRSSGTPSEDKLSFSSSAEDSEKLSELHQLLAQARYHLENVDDSALAAERKVRERLEVQLSEEQHRREELVEQEIRKRDKSSSALAARGQDRPLTRYLPIRDDDSEVDLRAHIESAGHAVALCPHVTLTATTCRGYLLKMGGKVHRTWNKRWFVFDREKRALLYYTDKVEHKPRGGIYFQTIEDVFVDQQKAVKSPNQKLTFCIKTFDRPYYLVAKTAETMSLWIDVIFTGAEAYEQYT